MKTGECTREKCKFQHVRGTKLVRGARPETLARISSTGSDTGQVLASGRGIEASGAKLPAREQRDCVRWPAESDERVHFLELRDQIQLISVQLQSLMNIERPHQYAAAVRKTCHCH